MLSIKDFIFKENNDCNKFPKNNIEKISKTEKIKYIIKSTTKPENTLCDNTESEGDERIDRKVVERTYTCVRLIPKG